MAISSTDPIVGASGALNISTCSVRACRGGLPISAIAAHSLGAIDLHSEVSRLNDLLPKTDHLAFFVWA